MEVRGSVTDRPWGLTLGAIALRRHTGQLTVESDGKRYCIAFQDGAIVAATSPAAADGIARVALTNHFITSTQVPDLTRRLTAAADRDEVEVIADAIKFTPDQILKLRHRLVAQRAARTFSLERGDFVLDDRIGLPVVPGVAVDHRHVIYLGARTNLAEQRLIDDLRQLGSYFVLKPESLDELPRYGFEAAAQPVLDALRFGTSLPELEASNRDVDPRFAQAIIYALVSCTACVIPQRTATQTARAMTPPTGARALTPRNVTARATSRELRAGTANPDSRPPAGRTASGEREPRTSTGEREARTSTGEREARTTTTEREPRTRTGRREANTPTSPFGSRTNTLSSSYSGAGSQDSGTNTPAAMRTRNAPDTKPDLLPSPTPTPATAVPVVPAAARTTTTAGRSATPSPPPPPRAATRSAAPPITARTDTDEGGKFVDTPTPSPLPGSAKVPGAASFSGSQPTRGNTTGQRPTVNRAPTPSDAEFRGFGEQRTPSGFPEQRTPGFGEQRTPPNQRTPTDPAPARTATGSPVPSRVSTDNALAADEAFKRGELAMKRDQPGEAILEFKTACDLNPSEVDYAGMLAWAKFCAAGDKAAIGADTRKALERALYKSNKPERARFYLGRVERMLGRDKEALRHFMEVLDLKPNHAEAASEVRAIEARLQTAGKTGLFGRKR
jgi:uncharacterized protein DUF4388